jgi:predicted dehydrogenase
MPLNVAIVGCGKIADGHVEEIQKMPDVARVVAVCDLELLMAEQIAVRYGIPRHYDDFDRLLSAERPDVVHITTPPQSHLALAKRAIDAGAHVYVEKPLTLNYEDSKQLCAYAEKAKRKLTIGYSYLFDPPALAMRDLIAEGVLGDPIHIESFYGYNLAGPFGAAILGDGSHWVHRLPGKLFHNNIDHVLYKVTEFLDDEAPKITATGSIRRAGRFGDARDDMLDELRVMIQGERTSVYGTFSSHIKPAGHFARVYGTKNTFHVDYVMRTVTLEAQTTLPSAIGRLVPALQQGISYLREGGKNLGRFARSDFHYFSGLNRLFAMYYESIRTDGPLPISTRDILRIAWMMDEIFRQVPQDGSGRRP